MHKEKLLALADHMERVDRKAFYQEAFFRGHVTSRKAKFGRVKSPTGEDVADDLWGIHPKEGFCGTSACVLGHAVSVPETGLFLVARDWNVGLKGGRRTTSDPEVAFLKDDDLILTDFEAGSEAFDIPMSHADIIFGSAENASRFYMTPEDYAEWRKDENFESYHKIVTPARVAQRLRDYVASDGKIVDDLPADY